jgi:hypothetical protein
MGCVSAIDSSGPNNLHCRRTSRRRTDRPCFRSGEIRVLDPSGNVERVIRSTTRIASYGAAILPLPAGTLTQLEMFQKRLNVLGKTLGHTPSLGVFCWLEVIDFEHFFGFLFLVLHVCYSSFAIR